MVAPINGPPNTVNMNVTCDGSVWLGLTQSIMLSIWSSISGLAAIVGNGVVLWLVYKTRSLWTISNLFLTSLATADLLVGLVIDPVWIALRLLPGPQETYHIYRLGSKVIDLLWMHTTVATSFNLCCVTVDRYIAIFYPLRYQEIMTKNKCYILISFVWLSSLVLPFSRFLAADTLALPELWFSFGLITVLVPMIVIIVSYSRMFKAARKKFKIIVGGPTQAPKAVTRGVQNYKAAITVGLVLGFFIIFWLPSLVTCFVKYFTESHCLKEMLYNVVWAWVEVVAFTSSAINPWIYCLRSEEFRDALRRNFGFFVGNAGEPRTTEPDGVQLRGDPLRN